MAEGPKVKFSMGSQSSLNSENDNEDSISDLEKYAFTRGRLGSSGNHLVLNAAT